WNSQAYLKSSDILAGDGFGTFVALAGNTLAAGAPNRANGTGSVYIFEGSGPTWTQTAKLGASNAAAMDTFGIVAFASNGNAPAVSATGEDGAGTDLAGDPTSEGASNSGAVYLFSRSGNAWVQSAYVKATN